MNVIEAVTSMLETYLQNTKDTGNSSSTFFHTNRPPNIPIRLYLKRLEEYMKCSEETYILALIYLDRITTRERSFIINSYCIHRVFFSGLVIAAKFFEDKFYKNSYYSRVGGISNSELNVLELQFLKMIDFKLFVEVEEYENYRHTLMQYFGSSPFGIINK